MNDDFQTIFNIDLKVASPEDLKKVVEQAQQLLRAAQAEENTCRERESELQAKRSAYGPSTPIYRIEYIWKAIVIELERIVSENGSITKDELYNVMKRNRYTKTESREKVWRCPMCGGGYLRVVRYADERPNRHQVTCDCCNWSCPKVASTDYDAWDGFEKWLKEDGWYSFEGQSVLDKYFDI